MLFDIMLTDLTKNHDISESRSPLDIQKILFCVKDMQTL